MNLMEVGEFDGRMLYTGLRLDYRPRLWAPTSASRAISVVAELLVSRMTSLRESNIIFIHSFVRSFVRSFIYLL